MSALRLTVPKVMSSLSNKRRIPAVLLALLCLGLTVKFQVLSKRIGLSRTQDANSAMVIDIDIGTLGTAMASSAHKLLTFDPFDKLLMTDKLERYIVFK